MDINKFSEKKTNNVPRVSEFCVKFDELELVQILTDCRNYRIPERFEHWYFNNEIDMIHVWWFQFLTTRKIIVYVMGS